MHPIERLRFVARAGAADPVGLAGEAALALEAFDDDPAGLVAAARRLAVRHPGAGPLWWTCSRMLTAAEPRAEGRRAVAELESDPTPASLAAALPDDARVVVLGWPPLSLAGVAGRGDLEVRAVDDGTGVDVGRLLARVEIDVCDVRAEGLGPAVATSDLVLLEADAVGPDAALGAPGSRAAAAVARSAGRPVWLVAGEGRALPGPTFAACVEGVTAVDEPWESDRELVPLELVDRVVCPAGEVPVPEGVHPSCPVAPELLRPGRTPGSHRL